MGTDLRICVIGFGNMGRALVRGWQAAGIAGDQIFVSDPDPQTLEYAHNSGLRRADTATRFDVAVVAVKPQQLDAALTQNLDLLKASAVVVSVAAGKPIAVLEAALPKKAAVVRAMPNTPAAIAKGVTVLCANNFVTRGQRQLCSELLAAVGAQYWVDEEALMDAVTAVSGSGPAYVFLLIECLSAAGISQGLPGELAKALALHTVAGSGVYAETSKTPIETLRKQVTSPGGTTEAALNVLMGDNALKLLIDRAVAAAAKRSSELS